jgi:hypothetical protein
MIIKRNVWLLSSVVIVILVCGSVFIQRQYYQFTGRLQSMPADIPKDLTLDPLASVVVDSELLQSLPDAKTESSKPLLERYKENPKYSEARAQLALTWLHANLLAKDLSRSGLPPDRMYGAGSVPSIPTSHSVDAWGNQYCVFRRGNELVVISTWNNGHEECKSFLLIARKLANPNMPATLKAGPNGTLITVQPLSP